MAPVDVADTVSMDEALRLQQEWREEIRDADRRTTEVPRLGDYAESWMRSKGPALKPSTARTYAEILDVHVLPAFRDFFLDKIGVQDVRRWHGELGTKMAVATANNCLRILKMVLADAVVDYDLPRSPAERLRSFPVRRRADEDANTLEADELGKVLVCFRETEPQYYPLALTLALTGLRWGEATALRWSDIDENSRLIRVERAQWNGHVSTTKTGVIRSVPLVPELSETLRAHRARQIAEQAKGLEGGWVFVTDEGELLRKAALRWALQRVLERGGSSGASLGMASASRSTTSHVGPARSSPGPSPGTSRRR
jgi:integrase